jgi:DNA-binding NtrC family response regulator
VLNATKAGSGLFQRLFFRKVLRSITYIEGNKERVMPAQSTLQGKKILVVEDDYVYRIFLQSVLKKAGALCTLCINAEYAKIKIASEQFDVFMLDYLLPGNNALEIIKWIREQNILTPAVIVTAYPFDEMTEKCKEEENIAIIIKSKITIDNFSSLLTGVLDSMTTKAGLKKSS